MLWNDQSALVYGFIGVLLVLLSNLMKRMIPLRLLAIFSTLAFGLQGLEHRDWPAVALHASLLIINLYQLWDIHRTLKAIEHTRVDAPVHEWLLPHMKKKTFESGHVLWNKGDDANHLVYVEKGTMLLPDNGRTLGPGSLLGEIGLFSMDRQRTATIVCQTKCVCHTMTDEAIHLLYFQNPHLGFYLIRLIVQRLLEDVSRVQEAGGSPSTLTIQDTP
jgi:CRP-like cAMP-binding protein